MAIVNTMEIVSNLVQLLTPLSSEERQRVIGATLVLLGETSHVSTSTPVENSIDNNTNLPQRALLWIKQNQLSMDTIEQVFHITEGNVEVIAHEIPGKSGKEKTLNIYLLIGIAKLLSSGEPTFDDKSARLLCKSAGCYSEANHALYLKGKGNEISGSKERGWVLTTPGLKRAASVIKELVTV